MQNSTLYPTVYVLGNGQLGRMLGYAGTPLDIYVEPLAFNAPVFIGGRMQSAALPFQMETACTQHQHRGGKQYFVHILPFSKAQSR